MKRKSSVRRTPLIIAIIGVDLCHFSSNAFLSAKDTFNGPRETGINRRRIRFANKGDG